MRRIVDLHCHYVVGEAKSLEWFRALVADEQLYRVAVCAMDLKLPYSPDFPHMHIYATTNEHLADLVAKVDSPKLVPWCYIDPMEKDAAKQADYWLTRGGMKGIKMYPPMGWYPDDPRAIEVCRVAAQYDVPVLLHMGRVASHPQLRTKFGRPVCLEDVGLACPKLKLIIGHWANMWRWEAFHIAMSFENFFFDLTTSGSLHLDIIRQTIRHSDLGLRRIILGTDGCGANNLKLANATLDRLGREGGLSDWQLDQIAFHNGLAVLGEKIAD